MTTGMTWGQLILFGVLVFLVGLVGGFVNALRSDNGFLKPRWEFTEKGEIWRPGVSTTPGSAVLRPSSLGSSMVRFLSPSPSW